MPCKGKTEERSVKDVNWEGWNRIKNLLEKARRTEFKHGNQRFKRKHARGLIIVGFKTGARVSEMLPLTRNKVSLEGEFWTVTLPLVKKYKKTEAVKKWKCEKCGRRWNKKPINIIDGSAEDWRLECREGGNHKITEYEGYKAKKIEDTRTIEFPSNEPLNEEFRNFVESCDDLLFPHPTKEGEIMKRSYAYNLVTTVDENIWLHWLRAQRAGQVADELGFTVEDRQDWFKWEEQKYAKMYGSRKYELRDKWRNPKRRIR